jgi:hypothetical protein
VRGPGEEVDQEAERILDPEDVADAAYRPGGQPLGPAAERRVVPLRVRKVGVGSDPEPQRPRCRDRSGPQYQVVVGELVVPP